MNPALPPWAYMAALLVSPWATIALLVAGCLLLFHDLLTPLTWGWTGTLGVTALGLVFAAHVTHHTGGWIGVLCLLVGLALILLEIHVFPGHGMAAIAGLLFMFLGMFWSLGGARNVGLSLPVASVLTVLCLLAFFAYLPKSPVWKQLGRDLRARAALGQSPALFLGRTGTTVSGLRPFGVAEIGGVRLDVVTEGDFLAEGSPVVVSRVDGDRVVVDAVS